MTPHDLALKPLRFALSGSQRHCCTCPAVLTVSLPDGAEGRATVTDDVVDRAAWGVPVERADGGDWPGPGWACIDGEWYCRECLAERPHVAEVIDTVRQHETRTEREKQQRPVVIGAASLNRPGWGDGRRK